MDAFGRADGETLLAPERDPLSGRRIPSSRSRQNKKHHNTRTRLRARPKVLVAAGIAVAVVVAAAGAAIASSGAGKPKQAIDDGLGQVTIPTFLGGSTPPAAPGPTATIVNVDITGTPTVVANTGNYAQMPTREIVPPIALECRSNGCSLFLTEKSFFGAEDLDFHSVLVQFQTAATGHWHFVSRGTRSMCPGSTHTAVGTWDLKASGTSTALGITIPAHVTGTYTFSATEEVHPANLGGSMCYAASHVEIAYSTAPNNPFEVNPSSIQNITVA